MHRWCLHGADQRLPQHLMEQFDTFLYNIDTLNICMKESGCKNFFFDKMTAMRTLTIFPYMAFVYARIVPLWAAQLLPQLLMEQFDTLRIQCRHIEHMQKAFIIFVCTDSTENFFLKLSSAGLNYNLPSFFTESYCAGGGGGGI